MTGKLHLFTSLKRIRYRLLFIFIAIFIFELMFPLLATDKSIEQDFMRQFTKGPKAAQKILGEGFFEAVMKYGLIALGYFHPFLLALFIIFIFLTISALCTSEISSGTISFVLSRPISRERIFLNIALVQGIGLAILVLSALLSTVIGIKIIIASNLSLEPFIRLALGLYLLMLLFAGMLTLLASISDSGKAMITRGTILVTLFYIIDILSNISETLRLLRWINPFTVYRPFELFIHNYLSIDFIAAIIAISIIMFFLAARIFSRRDLPTG